MKTFVDGEILTAAALNDNFGELTTPPAATTMPFLSDYATPSNVKIYPIAGGRLAFITGTISRGSPLTAGAYTSIGIIPAGFRPVEEQALTAVGYVSGSSRPYQPTVVVKISATSGNIAIYPEANVSSVLLNGLYLIG